MPAAIQPRLAIQRQKTALKMTLPKAVCRALLLVSCQGTSFVRIRHFVYDFRILEGLTSGPTSNPTGIVHACNS